MQVHYKKFKYNREVSFIDLRKIHLKLLDTKGTKHLCFILYLSL